MGALALLLALVAFPITTPNPSNAAADAVVEGSRALGIDFESGQREASPVSPERARALNQAGVGAWVDGQIQAETEEIGEPPSALREFLEERREELWSVVAALEKDEPDWGPYVDPQGNFRSQPLLGVLRLERVLVAAALVEEYDGNRIDAGRVMDAAWSLSHNVSLQRFLMTRLIAMAAERMQAGALRKMREPSIAWLGRFGAGEGPWSRTLEATVPDAAFRPRGEDDGTARASREVAVEAFRAIVGALSKISPCELTGMSDADVWRPAAAALEGETNPQKRAFRDFYAEIGIESVVNALRRTARWEVDREMTLKVLQLRLAKEASKDGAWPEKLVDPTSAVCPAASYGYDANGGADLRFQGDVPAIGPVLPLTFRARNPEPAPTPTPAPPALTPTPGGAMIAPP